MTARMVDMMSPLAWMVDCMGSCPKIERRNKSADERADNTEQHGHENAHGLSSRNQQSTQSACHQTNNEPAKKAKHGTISPLRVKKMRGYICQMQTACQQGNGNEECGMTEIGKWGET